MTYEPDPEGELADWLESIGRSRAAAEWGARRMLRKGCTLGRIEASNVAPPPGDDPYGFGVDGITNYWTPSHAPAWILGHGQYRLISTPARPIPRPQ